MQQLIDKETKASYNFPGLEDRAIPKVSNVEIAVDKESLKKPKKTVESITPTSGTKKLILNKSKY